MKKITSVLLCSIFLFIRGCSLTDFDSNHETTGIFEVLRINSDVNNVKSETDYIYQSSNFTGRYSFHENRFYRYPDESEDYKSYDTDDIAIYGDWIYYYRRNELRRLNVVTLEDEVVFPYASIQTLNEGWYPHTGKIDILGDYVLFVIDKKKMYLFPVEGDPRKTLVEVNPLFPEEDKSGRVQTVSINGMTVGRYYFKDEDSYRYAYVLEEETGQQIIYRDYPLMVNVGDKMVRFQNRTHLEENAFFYYIEGEDEQKRIECLWKGVHGYSDFEGDMLTVENGKIYGIMYIAINWRSSADLQANHRNNILFCLDPETGESEILLETPDNRTRIIGYKNGIVYLMENYVIYSQVLGEEERKELSVLPQNDYYIFDWQSGYLVVRYNFEAHNGKYVNDRRDVAAVIKVE